MSDEKDVVKTVPEEAAEASVSVNNKTDEAYQEFLSKTVSKKVEEEDTGKKKKKKVKGSSGYTLRRPLRKWFWLFLLPMVGAFIIGFVWPFIQGIFLSFCQFRLVFFYLAILPDLRGLDLVEFLQRHLVCRTQ